MDVRALWADLLQPETLQNCCLCGGKIPATVHRYHAALRICAFDGQGSASQLSQMGCVIGARLWIPLGQAAVTTWHQCSLRFIFL